MSRYKPSTPRAALALAALVMAALTIGALVILPARMHADSEGAHAVATATKGTAAPTSSNALPVPDWE